MQAERRGQHRLASLFGTWRQGHRGTLPPDLHWAEVTAAAQQLRLAQVWAGEEKASSRTRRCNTQSIALWDSPSTARAPQRGQQDKGRMPAYGTVWHQLSDGTARKGPQPALGVKRAPYTLAALPSLPGLLAACEYWWP